MKSVTPAQRWLRFALYGASFWLVFCIGLPALLNQTDAWRSFEASQDKWDIHAGAVYYTDVPFTRDTESANRAAVTEMLNERLKALAENEAK